MPRLLRRVQKLEELVHLDPQYQAEQAALERNKKYREDLILFLTLFPEECQEEIVDRLHENQALTELFRCMRDGQYVKHPVPVEVARVYLEDPRASPYQKCLQCHLLLPLRWGMWRNTETNQTWQAPVRYFAQCPSCGGALGHRSSTTAYYYPYIPVRVEPPWEFT